MKSSTSGGLGGRAADGVGRAGVAKLNFMVCAFMFKCCTLLLYTMFELSAYFVHEEESQKQVKRALGTRCS